MLERAELVKKLGPEQLGQRDDAGRRRGGRQVGEWHGSRRRQRWHDTARCGNMSAAALQSIAHGMLAVRCDRGPAAWVGCPARRAPTWQPRSQSAPETLWAGELVLRRARERPLYLTWSPSSKPSEAYRILYSGSAMAMAKRCSTSSKLARDTRPVRAWSTRRNTCSGQLKVGVAHVRASFMPRHSSAIFGVRSASSLATVRVSGTWSCTSARCACRCASLRA